MEKLLLDYRFGAGKVSNPDGTFPVNLSGTSPASAPGNTSIGQFSEALNFGTAGKGMCDISTLQMNADRWCVHLVFKATSTVNARQNLVESDSLPFSIYLTKGSTSSRINLVTSVKPQQHGWAGPDTMFKRELQTNAWHTVSLVYDYDTAALFLDGSLLSVHAFPAGKIVKQNGGKIYFGTWVDGRRNHFPGDLAAFQLFDGIPTDLEDQLDERRNHAEWHITYKLETTKKQFNPGDRTQGLIQRTAINAYIQHYTNCAIMFHHSIGVAFTLKGAIYAKFKSLSNADVLGYLVTDEENTTKSGGKKSLFSKGGIYWSSATGAVPVMDRIYLEYENLGESRILGFPTKPQKSIAGGLEQEFQGCRMYYRHGAPQAHEVHGSILSRFLALGGVTKWGYPVTNESDIKKGTAVIGKFSEFEGCTIYWSGSTGAFEVHGDIRRKYLEIGGPLSDLGFPTSNESNIPHYAGTGRANTFKNGCILWYGSYDSIRIARPFRLWLGRIDSKESEGFGMGQNDLYINNLKLTVSGAVKYSSRLPSSGDWGGKNIVNVNFTIPVTIVPNQLSLTVKFYVHIKEADPGADDEMGKYEYQLSAANAWGLFNDGIFNVSFGKIRSMTWSVKPQVNTASLSETQKWWGVKNKSTPSLTYNQYASAFKGVDSETEWWDVTDWLEKAYYEAVVKGIANGGNCFGMSLEGIYARKGNSLFGLPLDRFTTWNTIKNEVNIKHCYQVGANPIWWFLGQFVTGNTHSPVSVFNETLNAFIRGSHPVVCIAQNYDFTGAPHCILPVHWNKSSKPWKMTILDPNFPGATKTLTVDPDNNTFRYVGESTYSGGQWSGGRFHYMPFSILDGKQRVPIWDLILLILSGTIIILADDAETVSITDAGGRNLNAHGSQAANVLKSGGQPNEFFVAYTGFQSNLKPGNLLFRREIPKASGLTHVVATPLEVKTLKAATLTKATTRTAATIKTTKLETLAKDRYAQYLVSRPETQKTLTKAEYAGLLNIVNANADRNYIHRIKGIKKGKLNYVVKSGFSEIKIEGDLNTNETHRIEVSDLATNFCKIKLDASRAKTVSLEIKNKLGVSGDYTVIRIKNIAVSPTNHLELNVKQGLDGIELLNRGTQVNLNVEVATRINNVTAQQAFRVPVDTGIRIKPASVLSDRELTVNGIDTLFGRTLTAFRVK